MRSVRAFFQSSEEPDPEQPVRRLSLLWLVSGAAVGILLTGTAGFWGYSMLTRLPEASSCRSVNWNEDDSPSLRLQCAQSIASTRQPDDLLEAIRLAQSIPTDQQALRQDSDRLIKRWSEELVGLAEDAFHSGALDEAVRIARRVPLEISLAQGLDDRVRKWQSAWSRAEEIYKDSESQVAQENWSQAFGLAKALLGVGNTYWATTKYQELLSTIQDAKEGKGEPSKSKTAKSLKDPKFKLTSDRKPLPTANDLIGKWQQEQDAKDLAYLERARSLAQSGKPEELQAAVDQARRVLYGNANYAEAQRLIGTWNNQAEAAEDRVYLDRATRLASKGDAESLQAAISETYRISGGRPLSAEARDKADQWSQKIEQLRARPQPADFYRPVPSPTVPPLQPPEPLQQVSPLPRR
jgi:hypothetical protein